MKVVQKILRKPLGARQQQLGSLLLTLTLGVLLVACAGRAGSADTSAPSSTASQAGTGQVRMGSEEFGLSKQELVESILTTAVILPRL